MFRIIVILSMMGSLLYPSTLAADDTIMGTSGGTVVAIDGEHDTIRLVAEFVRVCIKPRGHTAEVECVFVFHNQGPTDTLLVGFPEFRGRDTRGFKKFSSFVDGVAVMTNKVDGGRISDSVERFWWTKTVDFPANEHRIVRNTYIDDLSYDTSLRQWFSYILDTGSVWAGSIGAAEIVVVFDAEPGEFEIEDVKPKPTFKGPTELRWYFSDFEPAGSGLGRVVVQYRPIEASN